MDNTVKEKQTLLALVSNSNEVILYDSQVANLNKHSPKIRTFDDDHMSELRKRLLAIIYSLGFKKAVESDVIHEMAYFIQSEFGQFTLEDVAIAFRKAIAGKLPGDIKDIKHYQSFDMQYLGSVCAAYDKWRREQIKLAKEHEKEKEEEQTAENTVNTYGDPGEGWFNIIDKIIQESGKLPIFGNWEWAYIYAEREGIIKVSIQDKEKFKRKVIKQMHSEIKSNYVTANTKASIVEILKTDESISGECRSRYMKQYFTEKINEKP